MELHVKGRDEPLAATIRRAREQSNLSQVEFAALMGVSPRTVQYWEAGQVPQPKHRRKLWSFIEGTEVAA